jgi:hypothetical protein
VVDTCLACSSASEQAWNVRYNCPGGQKGGKNKKRRGDITREFMLVLLQGVVSDYNKNREQRISGCNNKLKNMVERDFVYNQTKGDAGVDLICRHMADLRDAFPKMDISVTHFRDFEKHSGVSILLVQGVMRGPWLNRPASNEYEHLAVVFHLMPNRARNKIKEVHFRSEYLTEETYKKIRALDLLHTAFAVNSSAKAMVREIRDRDDGNKANNIEALPVMGVPLLLAASTMPPNKPENAEFNKELEMAEAEMNKNNNLRNANHKNGNVGVVNVNLVTPEVEKNNFLMEVEEGNNNNTESETEEDEEDENNNKNEEIVLGNLPTANLVNEVHGVENEQDKANLEAQLLAEIQDAQNAVNEGANEENNTDEENEDNEENENNEENEENENQNQLGGDGYYAAVERIPVGGQPVYQGYSSCCPPYFVTDGSQYDAMCQSGGGRKEVALGSKTLSLMKDGVVYSMTATVLEEAGNDTASAMGMKGPMKARVKHHLKKHMHDHAHAVVRKNVENGVRHMSKALSKPRGKTVRLVVIPSKGRGKKGVKKGVKKGGNLLGTLGTILFPAGSTVENVVPWLLTIGALMGKRIETDMYSIVDPQKRRVVRKKARRAAPKKKTRRRKPAGKKKVRRKTPAKKKTRRRKSPAKKKSRRRTASKSKKRKTTKRKKVTRRRGPRRGRRWQPLSNADIRRMMTQRGGFCGAGICGDASLSPFDGCRRPEWGPRNWVKPNAKDPICI